MNERRASPTPDIVKNQLKAGDPDCSAWVSANAGSGKTHILVERVLRLLLSGVAPENILCLTYTKAAAAEMSQRVAFRLSEWAVIGEAELHKTLNALGGMAPSAKQMARARTLFAHALETPGGLKINTIHAFCEAALHRFPLEAEVPVGFCVIEDAERAEMVRLARERVLAEGLAGDEKTAGAVGKLFATLSDAQIETAVDSALGQARQLKQVLADPEKAKANLRKAIGIDKNQTIPDLEQAGLSACVFNRHLAARVFELTPPGDGERKFEDLLARIDWNRPKLADFFKAFLTNAGTARTSGFPKKKILDQDPELAALMLKEAERLQELLGAIKHVRIAELSEALLDVLGAINKRYENGKQFRGRLDFDDLVTRFEALITKKQDAEWVRYKLDSSLTHILVDESQDTNPDQWNVVTKLVEEFFAGQGAVERPRSVFAVGDEKQSIYSFQGADPALFGETGRLLRNRAANSRKKWENIRFRASFRTLENILTAIDYVSIRQDISEALLWPGEPEPHESARTDKGGMVTLWPPLRDTSDAAKETKWPTSPQISSKTIQYQLARRIVGQICHWLEKNRPLAQRQRPVRPDDILILVQSRGPLFEEIIRALKKSAIPTPGADRLPVSEHIVVRDLLTLGDVLLTPEDDLSLATLLRSPLFSLSESELESLCIGRKKHTSVWSALREKAKTQKFAHIALEQLTGWRDVVDFDRPYEFFAHILFASGGLRRFYMRLGGEIEDVINEFMDLALAHEQSTQPSLQGFLASMRVRKISIKREFSTTGGVRIMTVHGAKGLEAPIVILADAASCEIKSSPVFVRGGPTPFLAHISPAQNHTALTDNLLRQPAKDAQMAEYWRKLYVAMTRAEDELYITGYLNKKGKLESTWYQAVEDALKEQCATVKIFGEDEAGLRFPEKIPARLEIKKHPEKMPQEPPPPPLPGPLERLYEPEIVHPSLAGSADFETIVAPQNNAREPTTADQAKNEGVALHALLQHLADFEPGQRQKIAGKAIEKLLPDQPQVQEKLTAKALAIFSGPDAQLLFGKNSRAELPILISGFKNSKPARLVGRIDRLIIQNGQALVVDFKSNATPPANPNDLSLAYKMQLGLYLQAAMRLFPDLSAQAAIYWSASQTLMYLSNKQLLDSTQNFNFIDIP
ncbi:FIG061771: ATP-dependent nuclease subunit A [hydrothermal vent metagenome]|uniref:DNA 3'-5' helicase n=1 Tax=hydrothermal vent metagenome TaxID=652676 RepID=A0A3B0TWK4_9ZZZZ